MIKFFRKIRQKLVTENKFSKYLLYAIGEIVLVVIGILIALTLNNNSERNKSEKKVLIVFEELLNELESDIKSIKNAGLFYEKKDSLTFLVINTNLNREDYQNNFGPYYALTTQTNRIDLSNNAYNKLVQMSDAIPVEYNEIMKELYVLNQKKSYIDQLTTKMDKLVNDIIKYNLYNYSWKLKYTQQEIIDYLSKNNIPNQQEIIDYLYNDNRYKSDVKLLSFYGVNEHFQHAIYYMRRAIRCYKEIATLLNKPIDYNLLGFDPKIAKTLTGDWTSEQLPGLIFTVYIEDNQLLYKSNSNTDISEIYFLSETKLVNSNIQFNTLVNNGNEIVIKSTIFTLKKTKG